MLSTAKVEKSSSHKEVQKEMPKKRVIWEGREVQNCIECGKPVGTVFSGNSFGSLVNVHPICFQNSQ